jgi:DNA-binding MarR family transcriptional regulator
MTETNVNSVVENLIVLQPLLYKNLIKPAKCMSPLSPGVLFVMGLLKRHGDLSMSEIGKYLSMPKPHVTGIVDKLIAEQFVERLNDPNDRRVVKVHLTELGGETLTSIKKEISENLRQRLMTLDESRLEQLANATQLVRDVLSSLIGMDESTLCEEIRK